MLTYLKNALLRARFRLAKSLARRPHLSDHQARDIGLSGADLERHRLTLPSQSKDRPLI